MIHKGLLQSIMYQKIMENQMEKSNQQNLHHSQDRPGPDPVLDINKSRLHSPVGKYFG